MADNIYGKSHGCPGLGTRIEGHLRTQFNPSGYEKNSDITARNFDKAKIDTRYLRFMDGRYNLTKNECDYDEEKKQFKYPGGEEIGRASCRERV